MGLANNVDLIYNIDEQLKAALIKESELFLMPSVKYKKSVEGLEFHLSKPPRMEWVP